jgi:ASC-1-like (ASCH) protein
VQVVQSEEGLMRTHKRNHKFFSAILKKMPEDKIVRDVWTIEEVEKLHTETMAA